MTIHSGLPGEKSQIRKSWWLWHPKTEIINQHLQLTIVELGNRILLDKGMAIDKRVLPWKGEYDSWYSQDPLQGSPIQLLVKVTFLHLSALIVLQTVALEYLQALLWSTSTDNATLDTNRKSMQ